jgi:hypothetical protein
MSIFADLLTDNLFFVTQRTAGNEPVLRDAVMMRLMAEAWTWTKERTPFERIGYLFLPEQIQVLLTPSATTTLDRIMQRVRQRFHAEYHELLNMPGHTLLWQEEYSARRVVDVETLGVYLDAMHLQPVQRGFVDLPAAWPYSSFALWQERGIYQPGWGCKFHDANG